MEGTELMYEISTRGRLKFLYAEIVSKLCNMNGTYPLDSAFACFGALPVHSGRCTCMRTVDWTQRYLSNRIATAHSLQ